MDTYAHLLAPVTTKGTGCAAHSSAPTEIHSSKWLCLLASGLLQDETMWSFPGSQEPALPGLSHMPPLLQELSLVTGQVP